MRYVLLGAGWYFNPTVSMQGVCYVADSLAPRQEIEPGCRYYGPAAWGGKNGPLYGRELVKIRPLHWNAWYAKLEDEFYGGAPQTEVLRVWPATLAVTDAGREKGLGVLDGITVGSEEEMIARMNFFAQRYAVQSPLLYTGQGRLQNVAIHLAEVAGAIAPRREAVPL
ncbi:hypothetical protein [Cupriavidus sp. TMH.W2]|uniref:hypothetical protein n=1 Tax=Cupriavidus sp. TMH.W2 TaxID=3434465 RepID=UPI003D770C23